MRKTNRWIATAVMAAAVCLGVNQGLAQDNNNNRGQGGQGGQGGGRGGRFGGGNFDPAQMQQRYMESLREDLEVKDDAEWKALEPLVQKVTDARRAADGDRMRGFFGRRGRGGDGGGGGGDQGGRRGGFFGQQPSAEAEALSRAIESKASNAELKAALAKFVEGRKAKQAELEKAQAELRKVLSLRQEAIATERGLL